jgi:hypothetical protein
MLNQGCESQPLCLSNLGDNPFKQCHSLHIVCHLLEVPNCRPGASALSVSMLRWRGQLSVAPLEQRHVDQAGPLCDNVCPWLLHTQLTKAMTHANAIQVLITNVLAGGNADTPDRAAHPVPICMAAACPALPNAFVKWTLLRCLWMTALCANAPAQPLGFILVTAVPPAQVALASVAIQLHVLHNALSSMLLLMRLHDRVVPITFAMGVCGAVRRRRQWVVCGHVPSTTTMSCTFMYYVLYIHNQVQHKDVE